MAQNNSVFVFAQKTSNDSCQWTNLRIDMNQVTSLKSLDFTWKKIANLLGVYTSFRCPYICNCQFCGRQCFKFRICISCCRGRLFPARILWSSLLYISPPSTSWYLETVFLTFVQQMVARFHPSAFLPFCQIYKWHHYFFWGILTVHDSI